MLKSFHVANFKSFGPAGGTLHLAPLTVLIGANASGKSNLIEAMRFLSWLASGEAVFAFSDENECKKKGIRGNIFDFDMIPISMEKEL